MEAGDVSPSPKDRLSGPPHWRRKLTEAELRKLKRLEMLPFRRRNLLTGGALLASVAAIFSYSMLAVKQEKLVIDEEFDEQTPSSQQSND